VRTIAIFNPKGGTAKTTTAVNVAASLAARRNRVLLIDMDPQGAASSSLGVVDRTHSIMRAIRGDTAIGDLIHETTVRGVQIVPASATLLLENPRPGPDLANALIRVMGELPSMWDFVLIDTAPTLGYLALAPIAVSDGVVIPVEARGLALGALANALVVVERVSERLNPGLNIYGILACRVTNSTHSRAIVKSIAERHTDHLMESRIRESIRVSEAPLHHVPVSRYAPDSSGDVDYAVATNELIERINAPVDHVEKL
jgi:chromosome partitioning protein